MKVYCDTSVLVALALQEPTWRVLADWLGAHSVRPALSSFGWGEFADGAARRLRRGELEMEQLRLLIANAQELHSRWEWIEVLDADVTGAIRYIADTPLRALKLPDAIHIAVSQRIDATLLTGDRKQASAAAELSAPCHLILPDPES